VGIGVSGVRGQKYLLLEPEMGATVLLPVRHEHRARLLCGVGGRAPELLRNGERLVVIARERDQAEVALHPQSLTRTADAPGTQVADRTPVTPIDPTRPSIRRALEPRRRARRAAR
jgi:hypothetical protein